MDSNPPNFNDSTPSVNDPDLVNKLVEELKSQGIFDQLRSDCLAEVDTKVRQKLLRILIKCHKIGLQFSETV